MIWIHRSRIQDFRSHRPLFNADLTNIIIKPWSGSFAGAFPLLIHMISMNIFWPGVARSCLSIGTRFHPLNTDTTFLQAGSQERCFPLSQPVIFTTALAEGLRYPSLEGGIAILMHIFSGVNFISGSSVCSLNFSLIFLYSHPRQFIQQNSNRHSRW